MLIITIVIDTHNGNEKLNRNIIHQSQTVGMWRIKNRHCFDWFSPIILVPSGQITQPQPNQQHSIFGKAQEWEDLSILLQHLSTCTTCADKKLFWEVASLGGIGFASHYHFANIPSSPNKIFIWFFPRDHYFNNCQNDFAIILLKNGNTFLQKRCFYTFGDIW